jgi:tetratricopeptide (TPR) repeat protein
MNGPTDFDLELRQIDEDISGLHRGTCAGSSTDDERVTRFAYRLYQRASLTGSFAELESAAAAIDGALEQVRHGSDLYLLKANVDFKFHRLADVKDDLAACATLRESTQGRALQADLDSQVGRYDAARTGYEHVIQDDPTWDNLARLAHLKAQMGDVEGADRLYGEAEDELTAKQMRHYAWLELQRGRLDLSRGRFDDARGHYQRGGRAYSGYWLVDQHMAELLGARGEFDEAVALYERLVALVPRAEFQQALGELYELTHRPAQAESWLDKACAAYLESAARGEVHYYHHLADFYADVRQDGAEAVRWARKDVELRDNFSTRAALAWSLYRARQFAEARDAIDHALASGAQNAQLFYQAGTIYRAAGENGRSDEYLRMASKLNPQQQSFHTSS